VAETKKQGRIGLERNLKKAGLITKKKGPASIHRKLQRSSKRSKKLSKNAMRIVDTSANLVEGYVNKKLYISNFSCRFLNPNNFFQFEL
jgi:hypothetical protein